MLLSALHPSTRSAGRTQTCTRVINIHYNHVAERKHHTHAPLSILFITICIPSNGHLQGWLVCVCVCVCVYFFVLLYPPRINNTRRQKPQHWTAGGQKKTGTWRLEVLEDHVEEMLFEFV